MVFCNTSWDGEAEEEAILWVWVLNFFPNVFRGAGL